MISYGMERIQDKVLEGLKTGKKATLLSVQDGVFYKLEEHICLVLSIEDYQQGKMATLNLLFANGVKVQTRAYIDPTIQAGCFAAVYGIYIQTDQGYRYLVKGGVSRIITRPTDLKVFDLTKIYRAGIVTELTELKPSTVYQNNNNIYPLGNTKLWYSMDSSNSTVDEINEENSSEIDTSGPRKTFITEHFTKFLKEQERERQEEQVKMQEKQITEEPDGVFNDPRFNTIY